MKRFFMLFMAFTVSVFALIGCGSDQDAEAITELQATIDDLQNQVQEYSALESELDSANNSIAELQTELDTLTAEKNEIISKLEILCKVEPIEETMYAVSDAAIYDDLYDEVFENEPAGTILAEQEIKVTGKSALDWYEIEMDGKKQYISGSLISTTKPVQESSNSKSDSTKNTGNSGFSQQPSGSGGQPSGGGQSSGSGSSSDDGGFDVSVFGGAEQVGGVNSGNFGNFGIE